VPDKTKSKRGFASFTREKLLAVSSKGGLSVPAEKRAFSLDPALAKDAARLGGKAKASRSKEPTTVV
jgi:general stress protein YciG